MLECYEDKPEPVPQINKFDDSVITTFPEYLVDDLDCEKWSMMCLDYEHWNREYCGPSMQDLVWHDSRFHYTCTTEACREEYCRDTVDPFHCPVKLPPQDG